MKIHMQAMLKPTTILLLFALQMVAPAAADTHLNAPDHIIPSVVEVYEAQSPVKSVTNETISNLWFTGTGPSEHAIELIAALVDSEAHGLNPESYKLTALLSELSGLGHTQIDKAKLQQLEHSFDTAFRLLAHDLGAGVLNPRLTQPDFDRIRPKVNFKKVLSSVKSGDQSVKEALSHLAPTAPEYYRLLTQMRSLLDEQNASVTRTTIDLHPELSLDDDLTKKLVRTRLRETGDLQTALLNKRNSTFILKKGTLATSELGNISFAHDSEGNFDLIKQALVDFQSRHGIEATGVLNKETVAALNVSVEQDIEAIAMNLERWRWMPRELGEKHIMINIPAYDLTLKNGMQTVVKMDVVVGSKKHKTPIFSEDASIIEVAPSWWIPAKITNNKLIPIELRRPGYFDSKNMDYWKSIDGKLVGVPRSEVTKEDYLKKPFPYLVRQKPGPDNALGDVKILMPNSYAVYMHDTQEKELFDKTDRAFSHGCIRLSNPMLLGKLLLQLDGLTDKHATEIMNQKVTTRINLKNKIPTHIAYFTAWIDDSGKLHKRKDVYGYNKKLIFDLTAKNTLLSNLNERVAYIDTDKGTVVAKN